jgi:transposase
MQERWGRQMEISPSDLSDAEWALLEPLIPPEKPGGRPREVEMRAVQSADLLRAASWLCLAHDPAGIPAKIHRICVFCSLPQ